jgi:hypothetical protein
MITITNYLNRLMRSSKQTISTHQDFTLEIEEQQQIEVANRETKQQFKRFMENESAVLKADCQTVSYLTFAGSES